MRRYAEIEGIVSPLDPLKDVLILLEYLTSRDYLVSMLQARHGLTEGDAAKRAKIIIPHVRAGFAFIEQSLATSADLSFLPAYYGILNFLKVYILVGRYHADLPNHRWHGASYPVGKKDSRNILTEYIDIKKGGAIPLFYKTITGQVLKPMSVRMSEIYPYVMGVTVEYALATGRQPNVRTMRIEGIVRDEKSKNMVLGAKLLRVAGDARVYKPRDFRVLVRFRRDEDEKDLFLGRTVRRSVGSDDIVYRGQFRPLFVYSYIDRGADGRFIITPIGTQRWIPFEELPIVLLFFHIGSVVRYKPDLMSRIRDSRYWPILASARQHCVLRFLILCWSYIHNRELNIKHTFG
jgi:YaaC-like Protein